MQGKLKEAIGEASVGDIKTNSKLKVQFFWPCKGEYWIIHLDKDYQNAIVSEPNRQFLWILSRSSHLDPETLETLKSKLVDMGFNLDHLIMTPQ
jgi:apolipoprotein D and lipocalin family protein